MTEESHLVTAKRLLRYFAGFCLLLIIGFGALFASVFVGNKKLEDGAVLNGHAVLVNDGYVGIFMLPVGDGTFALVDCGNDKEAKSIRAALEKRGATLDSVRAIFLTHGHPDHIAGCGAFPKADIYAFEGDVKLAAGEVAAKSPMGRLAGAQTNKAAKVTKILADGVEVQVGDLKVMPFALPGHTAGSAALLSHEVLYVGDSLTSKPDGSIVGPPWMFSDDLEQNKASVQKLAEKLKSENISVKTIALSHTGAINGVEALLEYAKR